MLLQQQSLVTSRLAPYDGWERVKARAKEEYEIFEKVVGFKSVIRIGGRFVNRIDVPDKLLADRYVGDLLNIKIELPSEAASSRGAYSLAVNFVHPKSQLKVLAQVAVGEPALIDHTSVFVDLDCAIEQGIPNNIGQMWDLVQTMRKPKNEIFESIITPEIRKLFK